MAPKKFPKFNKLPIELRRKIWNLSYAPRVIRAKWENVTTETYYLTIYRLSAGPVPRLLHVCKDSRQEGLRRYTPIAARLCFNHQPPKDQFESNRVHKIYVDLDRDTIYFLNYPSSDQFLIWWRRLHKPNVGGAGSFKAGKGVKAISVGSAAGNGLKRNGQDVSKEKEKENNKDIPLSDLRMIHNIAISSSVMLRISEQTKRLDVFYSLIMHNPSLTGIDIVLDNSNAFEHAKDLEKYHLKPPKPLPNRTPLSNLGTTGRGRVRGRGNAGGRWGSRAIRAKFRAIGERIWAAPRQVVNASAVESARKEQDQVVKAWEKWVGAKEREGWKGPELRMWSIQKVNKLVI